jgi:D-3-phosphoglycerate dehydrogenase
MNNKAGKVLIAAPVHPVLTEGLVNAGCELVVMENISQATAFKAIGDCTGVITSTRLQLNKELLDAAPQLAWIGRMGSGMEVIDVPYAQKKGVACYSSPEGNCNAVGEHALGMLLSLIRKIGTSQKELQQWIWKREENRGIELEGKTIGIIGLGHTGRAFAKKLSGFDMTILAYDKYSHEPAPGYVEAVSALDKIYKEADIISFHVPLQADTQYYFNADFLAKMAKPFVLVNTSRGPVVEMHVLKNGLTSGKIAGACLDVYEQEPLTSMGENIHSLFKELIQYPNFIGTPHIAGYTFEALFKMSRVLLEKIMPQTARTYSV